MSQKRAPQNESEACEIIETAIDNLELLTRAFGVIRDVCEELDNPHVAVSKVEEKPILH